jgi:alpha-L-rhamnosidase
MLTGSAVETYFPHFFYQGCRYLQVECLPAAKDGPVPKVLALEGVGVHSASRSIGKFACSNALFNRIHTLIRRAQENNMVSVLTDCPHRERLGWLEQDHLNGPSLRYEFDVAPLFTKILNDMADAQLPNGLVPDIAPEYTVFSGGFRDSPEWGSALPLCAWQQYEWTGDRELLQTYYPQMQAYVAYLGSKAKDDIVDHGLGDWYDLGPGPPGYAQLTPIALTATAFYYADTVTLARTAAVLGRPDDARKFDAQADRIRDAFNRKLFHADTGQVATGSQAANAIALVLNLVPVGQRALVLENLVKDVRAHGNGLTAGDVGYRYLLRALADGNRSDVIFDVNAQSDKPGYGYQLAHGATSLTEAWDARPGSSQDHFMLGQLMEWFYHDLVGIGLDPTGPGFKKILIHPQPVGDIQYARASCATLRGSVSAEWTRSGDAFSLSVTLPANTTATVWLPSSGRGVVHVNGASPDHIAGVRFVRQEAGNRIYSVGSGHYDFQTLR